MTVVLFLLSSLFSATTDLTTASLSDPEEAALNWAPIQTHNLTVSDTVLASILNLEGAHLIHGLPHLSREISTTLHQLLLTHVVKMRLYYLASNALESNTRTDMQAQEFAQMIVNFDATPEPSKLHQKLTSALKDNVLNQVAPFVFPFDLKQDLKASDTEPVTNLLKKLLETAEEPLLKTPLETLLSLNWSEVFRSFVRSGASRRISYVWGVCDKSIETVTALTKADSLEQLSAINPTVGLESSEVQLNATLLCKHHKLSISSI